MIALTLTIALAGCAFALSFDALRDLAVMLGMRPDRAYLWPVAIDVSIANSTLALLSFTPPRRAAQNGVPAASPQAVDTRPVGEPHTVGSHRNEAVPVRPAGVSLERREVVSSGSAVAAGASVSRQVGVGRPLSAVPDDVAAGAEVGAVAAPAAIVEWRPKAEELVQAGVTQKDPETVARILAERAAGTPPSTIGRRLEVHHSTVGRILAAADENIDESLQPEPAAL